MRLPGPSGHRFSEVPRAEIPRSSFDRSHGHKTTFDSGYLVPVFVDEALPGDTFSLSMTAFGRLATPIFPIMDNLYLNSFFFAVPMRLVWNNWEKFNGAQTDPGDSTDYLIPQMVSPAGGYLQNTLSDYFGLPTQVAGVSHSALFHRAYNLIYNDWFRDQNLQDSVVVDLDDGPDAPTDYVLLRRGKRHDYFTSALPWPQKGDAVELPLGTSAPVYGDGQLAKLSITAGGGASGTAKLVVGTGNPGPVGWGSNNAGGQVDGYWPDGVGVGNAPGLYADLSTATAASINQLRQAFQIQKLYERDARGGTRYIEVVKAHFGVTSPDARLQRPEYLGGGQSMVNVAPVAQTSSTDGTSPQGNLAAFGTVTATGHGFTKSFTEHCLLLGMVHVRADLTYQQGMNRMWSRRTRFDFFWPALSHIGEQAILNQEIFTQATGADDDVFGYQERFAEYRYKPTQITGVFRSNATGTLDAWHLSQDFASLPLLNAAFIVDNPPVARVVATPDEPEMLLDCWFRLRTARPMPMYGVPGLIDHF